MTTERHSESENFNFQMYRIDAEWPGQFLHTRTIVRVVILCLYEHTYIRLCTHAQHLRHSAKARPTMFSFLLNLHVSIQSCPAPVRWPEEPRTVYSHVALSCAESTTSMQMKHQKWRKRVCAYRQDGDSVREDGEGGRDWWGRTRISNGKKTKMPSVLRCYCAHPVTDPGCCSSDVVCRLVLFGHWKVNCDKWWNLYVRCVLSPCKSYAKSHESICWSLWRFL